MTGALTRAALLAGGFVSVMVGPPPTVHAQTAASPAVTPVARVCSTHGRAANAGYSDPWAITVSSEGGWCSHTRMVGVAQSNQPYQVVQPPAHGELAQSTGGGRTLVSYRPVKGYTGGDAFTLRYANQNIKMEYLVSVIP